MFSSVANFLPLLNSHDDAWPCSFLDKGFKVLVLDSDPPFQKGGYIYIIFYNLIFKLVLFFVIIFLFNINLI